MNDSCFENEWKDVQIVKQDEGPYAIMPIVYSEEYIKIMDILRSIIRKGEKSERTLKLTLKIIEMNPSNYIIWKYREDILEALHKDLKDELLLMENLAEENSKCYQIWHHRQLLIEKINEPLNELEFVDKMIQYDSKNYNAWTYRQWIVKHFNLWENELQYSDKLIKDDHRNNSAWNYRYYIMKESPNSNIKNELENEIKYVIQKINFDPTNQSPWQYIKGLIKSANVDITELTEFEKFCDEIQTQEKFPHAIQFQLKICEEQIKKNNNNEEKKQMYINKYEKLCSLLEETDPVRRKYWNYRKSFYN